jgi:hypothetical protein
MTSDGWLSNIPLFSFKTVFQTLLFPSGFPSWEVAAKGKITEPMVPTG